MESTQNAVLNEEAQAEKSKLRRAMGFWDLVLFYIATVVGLRWIATASQVGPSAISIWLMAFVGLFIPLALTVTELSSRYPEEGGIYIWSKRAFGNFHGFMTGWLYWTSNIVYFPGLLFFAASNAAYVIPQYAHLADDKTFVTAFSLFGLLLALTLNLLGLNIGKWLHNASGSLGTWLPAMMLIVMGAVAWLKFGPASDFSLPNLKPQVGSISDIVFWASIAFAFGGLESASVMSEEVRDARRNIPRALMVGGLMITFIYMIGTVALLLALPKEQTSGLNGIIDAVKVTGERIGGLGLGAGIGSLVALLLCIGNVGGVGAWIATTARLPFVAGIDRFLPAIFGRIHPRWGTPYVALLTQAAITAFFIVLAQWAGGTAKQAYEILVKLGVIAYFLPYLYLFASLIALQREPASLNVIRVPGGRAGAYLVGALGFSVTTAAIVLACIPDVSVKAEDKAAFYTSIFGTMIANVLIGAAIYLLGKRRRDRLQAAS
jgi:amino acid transporter